MKKKSAAAMVERCLAHQWAGYRGIEQDAILLSMSRGFEANESDMQLAPSDHGIRGHKPLTPEEDAPRSLGG